MPAGSMPCSLTLLLLALLACTSAPHDASPCTAIDRHTTSLDAMDMIAQHSLGFDGQRLADSVVLCLLIRRWRWLRG
jgi:hypothetical protein